jgi:hypothetical protein
MIEPEYFERKRRELDLGREQLLVRVQQWLETYYPGQARARQLHQGTLRIVTPNASVASDVRLRQVEMFRTCELADIRLAVSIGSLG